MSAKHLDSPTFYAPADGVVLSVIAPCFNEEGNIGPLVKRTLTTFDEMGIDGELILVDDGSHDGTWEKIRTCADGNDRIRAQRQHGNFGIEAAWRKGLQAARGHLICFIDSDLQNRPEDITKLFKTYIQNVPDLVQAVRHPVRGLRRRRLFSRALNLLLNASFGTKLRDHKSGFILGRKSSITPLLDHRGAYRYFQSFIGAAAAVRGYTIAEVDTDFEQRQAGKSFLGRFPILVSARIVWELMKYRVETNELMRARGERVDWFAGALKATGGLS